MMVRLVIGLVASLSSVGSATAQEVIYRNTLSEQSVETRTLSIQLDSVDDEVRFAVTMRDKETGMVIRH